MVFVELCVESFVKSKRCLPSNTHIELSRSRFTSRTCWLFQLLHKELSRRSKTFEWSLKSQVGEFVVAANQERSSLWIRSCHVVMIVSFLHKVAIGC